MALWGGGWWCIHLFARLVLNNVPAQTVRDLVRACPRVLFEYTSWPMSGTPLNRNRCRLGARARAGPQGYFVKNCVRVGEGEGEGGGKQKYARVKKVVGESMLCTVACFFLQACM